MSKSFYIKYIKSVNKKNEESRIDFIDGFNLIHGPSNTGKTLIIKCIDYLLGSRKIDGLDSQDYVEMAIDCKPGLITLKRKIEDNNPKLSVSSTVPNIDSGEYSISTSSKNKLSEVFLKILGIDELPIKIIKNEKFQTQQLSLRTFSHIFLLKESEILREESILFPKSNTANTALRSSLLFLLNGKNQDTLEKEESPEMVKLKNQAVRSYVNNKLADISNKELQISENIKGVTKEIAEQRLKEALKKVDYNNSELSKLTNSNELLVQANSTLIRQKEENNVSIKNFNDLIEQYRIDANRLSMILQGQHSIQENKSENHCPFCDSKINVNETTENFNSIRTEFESIQIKSEDLSGTLEFLHQKDSELSKAINDNKLEIEKNSKQINNILKPSIKKLEETIKDYRAFFSLLAEKESLSNIASDWNADLAEFDDDNIDNNKYKPLDRYPPDFFYEMTEILENILEECSFPNLSTARFDKLSFDAVINGETKSSQGKGYRAYLNSVVALSLLKYLGDHATYAIPLFVVDTPLLGLDEVVNEKNTSTENIGDMRTSFYNYLIKKGEIDQVIVIDNNKDLPELNFDEQNINSIEFTKSESNGRYGFLKGIRD
ncbi:MAG: AAA family ATPase [Lagierella massiliensis]|nr:AAA family ATPase [Lagierella massiliensis]